MLILCYTELLLLLCSMPIKEDKNGNTLLHSYVCVQYNMTKGYYYICKCTKIYTLRYFKEKQLPIKLSVCMCMICSNAINCNLKPEKYFFIEKVLLVRGNLKSTNLTTDGKITQFEIQKKSKSGAIEAGDRYSWQSHGVMFRFAIGSLPYRKKFVLACDCCARAD